MAASSTASAHEDASTKDHASSDAPVSAGADSTNRHALARRDNAGDRGRTSIADIVVAKVAGIAAREIDGVHDLGGATERAVGRVRDVLPGTSVSTTQGIEVEVGEQQAAVDVSIVAEYGVAIHQLAAAVRRNVISAIEQMTGLEVTEVNVTVHDIAFGDDDDQNDAAPRVQ
ncbi:Asp23/Gls24 family envelope stress response protein [Gordonia sp. zg691]|uniref:Asp23/Gls24 family envelope stress response protein n=1 Tax=Gordonia jinghuaiqii TaxID=2758710 RepID=A0A7D7LS14_9ACTN|nr:Asp23/Gls24 family envelope stress response protein [Gordonia jinghuaiqii]MBD0859994.1 Asp23/Gls24 family envelope stress response protein [Gordonia jinghuaiqii]MCR5977160.1 Asp23/Gls24 family envelope stress response protein [Gordonia jinghuaiqii]QMT00237.1 Asp23/Gls24 family envelope stress response protein [Gordonia jinghuaiqii]